MSTIAEGHFLVYFNTEGIHFIRGCWRVSENIAFIACFNIPLPFQDFDREEKKKIKQTFIFIDFLIWEISKKKISSVQYQCLVVLAQLVVAVVAIVWSLTSVAVNNFGYKNLSLLWHCKD